MKMYTSQHGKGCSSPGGVVEDRRYVPHSFLFQRVRLVNEENDFTQGDVIVQILTNRQIGQDRIDSFLLQVISRTDSAQHQKVRTGRIARREDHFLARVNLVNPSSFNELHTVSVFGHGINQDLHDVRIHGNVKILPFADGPYKRFRRGTSMTFTYSPLGEHETFQKRNFFC